MKTVWKKSGLELVEENRIDPVILVLGLAVLCLSSLPPTTRFAYLTATTLTSALLADLFMLPSCILIFKSRL